MKKYMKLANGNKIELVDYNLSNELTVTLLDIESDLIISFFGTTVIPYAYIVDDNETVLETLILNMKMKTITFEVGTKNVTEYSTVSPPCFSQEYAVNSSTGEILYDENGDPITENVFHSAVLQENTVEKTGVFATVHFKKPDINEQIDSINSLLGIGVNITDMSIDECKAFRIAESKKILAEYLSSHPLISDCHGNKDSTYTITEEKQSLMMSNYITYTINKTLNPTEAKLMWNETGGICEEWSEAEFIQLIIEIESIVKPLVSAQQLFEKQIVACNSMDDILNIQIDYSVYDVRNNQ